MKTKTIPVSINKKDYVSLLLLGGVLFALTFTIVLKQAQMDYTDYYLHMQQAASFRSLVPFHITYPIWHFLVYVVYKIGFYLLGGMPLAYACAFVTSSVNVAVFLVIWRILHRYECPQSPCTAFALCMVMPVYIPWYYIYLYIGQISPVTWHNPTNLMVKPFALAAFFVTVKICQKIREQQKVTRKDYLILAALVFFSILAKPSFFQGFVPALGIYIVILLIITKFRTWKEYLRLCLCFVPAFCVMLCQFYFSFHTGQGEGIGIGWMEVFEYSVPSPVVSTFLGIIFPVCYILLNLRSSMKDIKVQLSLLFAGTSWLEYALLYENGARKYHSNFSWAAMLAYSVLWVVTTLLFFRDVQKMDLSRRKTVVKNTFLFILWMIHLICGFYYVWYLMTTEGIWM